MVNKTWKPEVNDSTIQSNIYKTIFRVDHLFELVLTNAGSDFRGTKLNKDSHC